jgi:hypothetical protein
MKGFFESVRTELMNQGSNVRMTMVQLPGLNTPQFDHCRSKLPKKPMPVAPIYQPEVAAEGVYFAAHSNRRQVWVGVSTAYTIVGERLAPWLGDWYMAKTGVSSQQTQERIDPPRAGNLFEPVDGDPGAHGDFDAKAHSHSAVLWFAKHRRALAGVAVTATALTAAVVAAAVRG